MSTRLYPLYQKGNPQLRIFLPNFWMKLIKPKEPMPQNMVMFQTSIEMTEHDVKNYLEKIYKVPVVEVRTVIKSGKIRNAYLTNDRLVKDDDYKEAIVTMPRDYKFDFPNLFDTEKKEIKSMQEKYEELQKLREKFKKQKDVPPWFYQ